MVAAAMTAATTAVRLETRPRCRIALPCARPIDLRRRRGRFFRPALLPGTRFGTGHVLADHHRLYIRLAAASARVHPTRFPCLSRRLARAKVAANAACACCSARLTEAGVGWRSSCAPIDCGAIGPAFGFPADWRTACSNCAILLLHGPACAAATPRPRAAATSKVAESRLMARRRMSEHLHDVFDRVLPRFPARRRPDIRQESVTSA